MNTLRVSDTHEWRLIAGEWLMQKNGVVRRPATDEIESILNAAKRQIEWLEAEKTELNKLLKQASIALHPDNAQAESTQWVREELAKHVAAMKGIKRG